MIRIDEVKDKVKDVIMAKDVRKQILDSYAGFVKPTVSTGVPGLNGVFSWCEHQINVWTGWPNHGKSTFLRFLSLKLAEGKGVKCAFFCPEDMPAEYFYEDLIFMKLQRFPNAHSITEAVMLDCINFVNNHYFILFPENDEPTPDYINQCFLRVAAEYDVSFFVTDPFNQLDHDWNKHGRDDRYLAEYFTKCRRFVNENSGYYNIVAHPSGKPVRDKNGDTLMPDMHDLAGGTMWSNKCDNITIIHRPLRKTDSENSGVHVMFDKVKKKRITGKGGLAEFEFDYRKNIYNFVTATNTKSEQTVSEKDFLRDHPDSARADIDTEENNQDYPF